LQFSFPLLFRLRLDQRLHRVHVRSQIVDHRGRFGSNCAVSSPSSHRCQNTSGVVITVCHACNTHLAPSMPAPGHPVADITQAAPQSSYGVGQVSRQVQRDDGKAPVRNRC
jgi:hypothetical protein